MKNKLELFGNFSFPDNFPGGNRQDFRTTLLLFITALLLAVFAGCSSTGAVDGTGDPAFTSSALTGTWKLPAADSSFQVLEFHPDGTGIQTSYGTSGQTTKTTDLLYNLDDDTRFSIVGEKWIIYVPCEIQDDRLTLKKTGEVFTKQR
jgi:hypothetical protein